MVEQALVPTGKAKDLAVVVDFTGAGRGVTQLLWERLGKEIRGTDKRITRGNVTITNGERVTYENGVLGVPKADLVSVPLVLMQNGQLKIAEGLRHKDTLVKELKTFRRKQNVRTGHNSYEHWRESDHDDLVLSVAMATWAGEEFLRRS